MARPRKPTNLLELSGAFRKDPKRKADRANEPKYPTGLGEPPADLDEVAQAEWRRVAPELDAAGVAVAVERTVLSCYCEAVSMREKARALIAKDGITTWSPSGEKKHPACTVLSEAHRTIRAFASDFGLTPASRSKVSAAPGKNVIQVDDFASI